MINVRLFSRITRGGSACRSRQLPRLGGLLAAALLLPGCDRAAERSVDTASGDGGASVATGPATGAALAFRAPTEAEIPDGALGAAVRRGRALLNATRDSLPDHVGNELRCTSCHLNDGLQPDGIPWVGVYAQFPQYRSRNDAVTSMEDRINDCFRRSLNGRALDVDSREMREMVAYMAFLSRGYPMGGSVTGQGFPRLEPLEADTARGAQLFASTCVACHGADGQGTPIAPALWGPESYNIGAGMARLRTAAGFIKANMPFGNPHLTEQQAFDVAAYINAQPRPDYAAKAGDWPRGDPPPDVAYETRAGRTASPPPP